MTDSLVSRFGLGSSELIAVVGAGGKTTTVQRIGAELAADGDRVILTTTTKMSEGQLSEPVCWTADASTLDASFVAGRPLYAATEVTDGKVIGFSPETVDDLFSSTSADHVIVEADGARRMLIKAPAAYEPVIPSTSTVAIVVVGARALGQPIGAVAHRPDRIRALTGLDETDILDPESAAAILLHPDGGLKAIPEGARVVMTIANVTPDTQNAAASLAALLDAHPRIDRTAQMQQSAF
ncbi:MAG: selenium cofactor biosynthesis protein YqeC [Acidimicrobiia bacterium]